MMNEMLARIAKAGASALKNKKVREITSDELLEKLSADEPVTVIDIRSEWDYKRGHIRGSISLPLEQAKSRYKELDPERLMVFY